MTKILHVVSSVDPALGGVAESIVRRGEKLVEMGHQVEVVSLDAPDSPAIQGYPLPLHTLGPGKTHWNYSARLEPWLRTNCHRFDAVIVDGIWQHYGHATRKALKGTGVPYFVFPHGMLDPWFKKTYPLKHLKKWLFWPWCEYRLLKHAKAVLFTCQEERDLAKQSFSLYNVNPVVVPFGTAAPPSDHETLREHFYQQYPDLRDKQLLLFLSRIHPKKGCDLLVEAFARVAQKHPKLILGMAGPGEPQLIQRLKDSVQLHGLSNRVVWFGMLKGASKWGALYASAAFALPSHQENFGIAVAEAMACGVPVLISDKVNIWQEIHQGQAGLVNNDTVQGTTENLTRWLELTPNEVQEMGQQGQAVYKQHFTIQAMANGLLNAIQGTKART